MLLRSNSIDRKWKTFTRRFLMSSDSSTQHKPSRRPGRSPVWELPGGSRVSAWRRQTSGAIRTRRTTSFGSGAERYAGQGSRQETAWRCLKSSTGFCSESAQEKNAQKSKKMEESTQIKGCGDGEVAPLFPNNERQFYNHRGGISAHSGSSDDHSALQSKYNHL